MKGKFATGPAAALLLLLFFLPWVSVSCSGVPIGQFSGFALALDPTLAGNALLLLVPLAALVALGFFVLSLASVRLEEPAAWVQGAVALVSLFVLLFQWWRLRNVDAVFEVTIEPGLWGTILALLVMIVGAGWDIIRLRLAEPAQSAPPVQTPPSSYPRPGPAPQAPPYVPPPPRRAPSSDKTVLDAPADDRPPHVFANRAPATPQKTAEERPPSPPTKVSPEPVSPTLPEYDLDKTIVSPGTPTSPKTEVLSREPEILAWLVVRTGSDKGKRYRLGEAIIIGRSEPCDIVLDDTAVSGRHAKVYREDGRYFVEDLGSTNGVFLYETESDRWQEVKQHELQDGAQIKLGRTVLHLLALADNA